MVMLDESGLNTVSSAEHLAEPPTPTKRWRNLMNPRSISVRKFGSDEDGGKSSRRRRVAHTIDNTLSLIDTPQVHLKEADEMSASDKRPANGALLMSPSKPSSGRGSLLQRFLASTSRRKSQTYLSGEGSTVSRLTDDEQDCAESNSPAPRTRRATLDTGEIVSSKSRSPILSPIATPVGGLRGVLRRFSGDGPRLSNTGKSSQESVRRRSSRDSIDFEFPEDTIMEGEEYKEVQERLQRRADDLHKSGQIEEAISQWVECLALAEDNQDTLANKTELLCILVDLHLQASQLQHHNVHDDDDPLNPEDVENRSQHHLDAAERYVHRIKPAMVKVIWWSCSIPLLELLVKSEAWELAILVAERLVEQPSCPAPKPEQFATIHFQVASQKLDNNRQGEALQHLQATVKYLQLVEPQKRDMVMYTQVLQLLASEYNSHGQSALALEAYQEQLKCASIEKHASLYCRMAHIHIVSQQLDLALEQLEAAASSLDSAEPTIRLQLLQTKGDVYCRLGRMEESLEVYQSALKEVVNPAEKAKLLYTLGRLCVRLKRVRLAISYFTQEMEITEQELGQQHLSVSRVLHELAKLYDEGLGETKMALMKLHKALQIELAVLQECHYAITKCQRCNQVTHRMCTNHANLQREVSNQIRDTKKAQGRLHFKLGDFEKALKTSFDGTERRASIGSSQPRPSAVGL